MDAGPPRRADPRRAETEVVLVVAAGGVLGSLARYVVGLAWPTQHDGFPWATFTINVVGCLLIGVLMVLVTERKPVHPWLRPFLGVGVLGGFTTFSAYSVDIHQLLIDRHPLVAVSYLAATAIVAMIAVICGVLLTRRLTTGRIR